MKKFIFTTFVIFPVACFAIKWPETHLIPSIKKIPTPIGKVYCPQTIQCNLDYNTFDYSNVPCVNTQNIGPWEKETYLSFWKGPQLKSGVITLNFYEVDTPKSFISDNIECYYKKDFIKNGSSISLESSIYPKPNLYFSLADQSKGPTCESSNAKDCSLLMYTY